MKTRLLFLASFLLSSMLFSQSDKEITNHIVTKDKIKGHIYFLADDVLKGRDTGTPELKIAASYLANQFRAYGVKPNPKTGTYYQAVKLKRSKSAKGSSIKLRQRKLSEFAVVNGTNFNGDVKAVYLGHGLEDDYKNTNVKGKFIIVLGGSAKSDNIRTSFMMQRRKARLAQKNGALGIIEVIKSSDVMWKRVEHNFNSGSGLSIVDAKAKAKSSLVHVWIRDKKNAIANNIKNKKSVALSLNIKAPVDEIIISNNVIGVVEGTDPKLKDEYIIYSGHYDHVGIGAADRNGDTIYNGARDNAVGTTTVLSIAESLAKHPTKRSALFILFTGEEKGLLGSRYYVDNPVIPLNKMVYCFNSDNGGYNNTTIATIIGLPRTTAAHHIKNAATAFGITAVDDPAPEQGLFDRSDNVSFARKGIPAPTFSLGFTAFDETITKYYHRPSDEAHNLDYDYLVKFFKAYVLAGRSIANDPVTPTWTKGDKYESAAKALYKK